MADLQNGLTWDKATRLRVDSLAEISLSSSLRAPSRCIIQHEIEHAVMESYLYVMQKSDRLNARKQDHESHSPAGENWIAEVGSPNLKNDRHRKERGGSATFLTLFCSRCTAPLIVYQKDGIGTLQRCYLNRIFAPPQLEKLQHDVGINDPKDLSALHCQKCNAVVGSPMRHTDGRLAFRLRRGAFIRKVGIKSSPVA